MWESKNFSASYLTKLLIDLTGICFTGETCWYDKQIDCSLNGLDVHSRLQGCGKCRTCAVVLL